MRKTMMVMAATVFALGCGSKNGGDEDSTTDSTEDSIAPDSVEDTIPPDGTDVPTDTGGEDGTGDTGVDPTGDTPMDGPEDTADEDAGGDPADATDVPGDDGGGSTLAFTAISCLPDVGAGDPWVEGQYITCTFEVIGEAGRSATLACEDTGGGTIDCSSMSGTQIQPFGSNPLPIDSGWFGAPSAGLAGTTYEIVWVADDGTDRATHLLSAPVIADDGIDEQPTIEVDCDGDTDGDVSVAAGSRLDCTVYLLDPDPDSVSWDYARTSGADPVTDPSPFGGLGGAPYSVDWRWSTDAGESGGTWVYEFTANDGTGPDVSFDLTVHVL